MSLQDGLAGKGTDGLSLVFNGGTELMGVDNQYLIWIKAHFMRRNLYPTLFRFLVKNQKQVA